MAVRAAEEALESAGITMKEVSLILNASGTPQRVIPDNGPLFQRELGYGRSGIPAMSVHSTCLSFVSAIEVSAALLGTGSYENILVITSELASRGLDFDSPESASLFGDAATAAVLSLPKQGEEGALHAYRMETYGDGAELTTVNFGNECYPYTAGSTPKNSLFSMDGKGVFKFARGLSKGFFDRLVPDFRTEIERVSAVVPHQTTMLGIQSLKRHGIDMDRVIVTLPKLGNCVAASIPSTLYQAVEDKKLRRGERFLMVGTGAGLSLAAALLTY
jgi:3-oxoacyl-[acyl-carrier-protein] synthase-3